MNAKSASFLIECGLFQGRREGQAARNRTFPFDPTEIDYVILTHAHLDHCGRLPLLVRNGFSGSIYTTKATAELCSLLLGDVAETEEENAAYNRRRAETSKRGSRSIMEPLFKVRDVRKVANQLKTVPYDKKTDLPGGITLRFRDAGHILGSSIVETWIDEGKQSLHLVATGDIGRKGAPLIRDPDFPDSASYLLIESTYANRRHEPLVKSVQRFEKIIIKAHRHKSHILVPAFSIGRTQSLIYALNELVEAERVPIIPVAIDSPLAIQVTEIFKRHRECFDTESWELIRSGDAPLEFKGLRYVDNHDDSAHLTQRPGPIVIIAGSGMMNGGRILSHLYRRIEDKHTYLLIAGFQAPGTLGHKIIRGARTVQLYGRKKRVRARVEQLYGFSAHADKIELQHYIQQLRKSLPRQIFCVHGSPRACNALAALSRKILQRPAVAPKIGQSFQLEG